MDPDTLVTEQIDAGTKFLAELEKTIPVAVAFWLKITDQPSLSFYVASDQFQMGPTMWLVARRSASPWRCGSLCRSAAGGLIEPTHPLARAALNYQRLYPGETVRLRDRGFGDMGIDEDYIYPRDAVS